MWILVIESVQLRIIQNHAQHESIAEQCEAILVEANLQVSQASGLAIFLHSKQRLLYESLPNLLALVFVILEILLKFSLCAEKGTALEEHRNITDICTLLSVKAVSGVDSVV